MSAQQRELFRVLAGDQYAFRPDLLGNAGENPADGSARALTTSSERAERIHRKVMRFLLPVVLYGIGQILYWIWFDYNYDLKMWWKILETIPLFFVIFCVLIWWFEVSVQSEP
jgi:hypothetical protein